MKEEKFIGRNLDTWKDLESLSSKIAKKGINKLSSTEIKTFIELFKRCSHHLAYARTHFPQSDTIAYLNTLIGESQSHIYSVERFPFANLIRYIQYDFPELLKRYNRYILASFAFFILGSIIGLCLVFYNPAFAELFLPAEYIEAIQGDSMGSGDWNYPLMSSYIMVNNITVSLRAFVFGITLGLGTIYVLFYNGALLGALTALVYLYGDPLNYWSLILPHGVIELPAIWISGGAGLIVAKHMLLPEEYSRKDSLIFGTKKAVSLITGVVLLLIIAGLIEGFYTPRDIEAKFKLLFSIIITIPLAIYFFLPYFKKSEIKNKDY